MNFPTFRAIQLNELYACQFSGEMLDSFLNLVDCPAAWFSPPMEIVPELCLTDTSKFFQTGKRKYSGVFSKETGRVIAEFKFSLREWLTFSFIVRFHLIIGRTKIVDGRLHCLTFSDTPIIKLRISHICGISSFRLLNINLDFFHIQSIFSKRR